MRSAKVVGAFEPRPSRSRDGQRGIGTIQLLIIIAVFSFGIVAGVRALSNSTNRTLACHGEVVLNPNGTSSCIERGGGATSRPPPGRTDVTDLPRCPRGGCSMCFVAGTPVITAQGLRPIETIEPGTLVLSRAEWGNEVAWKPVVETFITRSRALLRLTTLDGRGRVQELTTTGNHPFFSETRGWVHARTLVPGEDLLIDRHGQPVRLLTADLFDAEVPVYNFEVADFHTYFVGDTGIWVHNRNRDGEEPGPQPPIEVRPMDSRSRRQRIVDRLRGNRPPPPRIDLLADPQPPVPPPPLAVPPPAPVAPAPANPFPGNWAADVPPAPVVGDGRSRWRRGVDRLLGRNPPAGNGGGGAPAPAHDQTLINGVPAWLHAQYGGAPPWANPTALPPVQPPPPPVLPQANGQQAPIVIGGGGDPLPAYTEVAGDDEVGLPHNFDPGPNVVQTPEPPPPAYTPPVNNAPVGVAPPPYAPPLNNAAAVAAPPPAYPTGNAPPANLPAYDPGQPPGYTLQPTGGEQTLTVANNPPNAPRPLPVPPVRPLPVPPVRPLPVPPVRPLPVPPAPTVLNNPQPANPNPPAYDPGPPPGYTAMATGGDQTLPVPAPPAAAPPPAVGNLPPPANPNPPAYDPGQAPAYTYMAGPGEQTVPAAPNAPVVLHPPPPGPPPPAPFPGNWANNVPPAPLPPIRNAPLPAIRNPARVQNADGRGFIRRNFDRLIGRPPPPQPRIDLLADPAAPLDDAGFVNQGGCG